jgi:hypothetical protein
MAAVVPRSRTTEVNTDIEHTKMYLEDMKPEIGRGDGSTYRAIMHQMSMDIRALHTEGCRTPSIRICSTEVNSCAEADKTNAAT